LRNYTRPTNYTISVIVGLLLSDAWIMRSRPHDNARFGFRQSIIHFPYLWHVFTILAGYCNTIPHAHIALVEGKRYLGVGFATRAYPFLTKLWHDWYSTGVKCLPSNIFYLLDSVALAHWIMCDGNKHGNGLVISCEGFTLSEIIT